MVGVGETCEERGMRRRKGTLSGRHRGCPLTAVCLVHAAGVKPCPASFWFATIDSSFLWNWWSAKEGTVVLGSRIQSRDSRSYGTL